jgi:hypothetical protein
LPPQRELAVGLIAEPGPSQLDQSMPSKLCARLVDSPITVGIAAVRGWVRDLRTKQRVVAFRMSDDRLRQRELLQSSHLPRQAWQAAQASTSVSEPIANAHTQFVLLSSSAAQHTS